VQDGSYFRKAVGVSDPTTVLHHKEPSSDECWTVDAVSLFQLHENGKLHPLAICIDYRGSLEKSVTIFNKRMSPQDSTSGEKEDWPWRYAKTCAQATDWMRHELAVHLTLSHFVEEAIIVAANRSLPMDHPVYRLLYPHWYKTLSLNAAARSTLVPQIIVDIVGISPDRMLIKPPVRRCVSNLPIDTIVQNATALSKTPTIPTTLLAVTCLTTSNGAASPTHSST